MTIANAALLSLCLIGCDAAVASPTTSIPRESRSGQQAFWRDDADPEIAHLAGASQARLEAQRRLRTDPVSVGGD